MYLCVQTSSALSGCFDGILGKYCSVCTILIVTFASHTSLKTHLLLAFCAPASNHPRYAPLLLNHISLAPNLHKMVLQSMLLH